MTKIEKVIYYAKNQALNHSIYLWGGQGEKVKTLTAQKIAAMETNENNAVRVMKQIYQREYNQVITKYTKAFDCSGLICKALEYAKYVRKRFDTNAQGLYDRTRHISKESALAGDLVFKGDSVNNITHVGILTTNGQVTEARGRDYGVVTRSYELSEWNYAGKIE